MKDLGICYLIILAIIAFCILWVFSAFQFFVAIASAIFIGFVIKETLKIKTWLDKIYL